MTYNDVIKMRKDLNQVNFIPAASSAFLYAVSNNKKVCDAIITILNDLIAYSPEYKKYLKAMEELNRKYAERDKNGILYVYNGKEQMYKRIMGEGIEGSDYEKEYEIIRKIYDKYISDQKLMSDKYMELLKAEVEDSQLNFIMVERSAVPDGLHPAGMDGCFPFIKKPDVAVK